MSSIKPRLVYLDLLRIASIFAMMAAHVTAVNFYNTLSSSFEWQVFNFYDSLARFCVPVFVMISGVFLLDDDKNYTIENILKTKVLRIVTAFVFWSACYAVLSALSKHRTLNKAVLQEISDRFIEGHYHLWFLFMILGLYLIVPFIKEITVKKHLCEYFMALSLIFCFSLNILYKFPTLQPLLESFFSKISLYFVLGYSGYFVAGYYLHKYEVSKKAERWIYVIGIISFLATFFGTILISQKIGMAYEGLYHSLLLNIWGMSVAIFVFFEKHVSKIRFSTFWEQKIHILSKLSFGMYLVHEFINILLQQFLHFNTLSFNPIFSVPIITTLIFIGSFFITFIINKIPFANKYII